MTIISVSRYAFVVFTAAVMLAGCSGESGTPLNPSPAEHAVQRPGQTGAYTLIYSFRGGADGANPSAHLTNVNGTLYGTTQEGGGSSCYGYGCGTVFAIAPFGPERVIHGFGGSGDGMFPAAGVISVKGTLYGTTQGGGANNLGTVFAVSPYGSESVIHSFGNGKDGFTPTAGLIDVKGMLYGTTQGGGANRLGTVFSIGPLISERVIHSFDGADGNGPEAGLTNVNGTLFGTTSAGGGGGCYSVGCGTVFATTLAGNEKVIYSFGTSSGDGLVPIAHVISVKGTLYGTTELGGANNAGIVFAISASGSETVLHSFGGSGADGTYPCAGLVYVNGTLYGTTRDGGANDAGTVFAISTSGSESVLHSFGGPGDGANSYAGLINIKGTLYGTTGYGGANNDGTVFSIRP